jgi:uncharacterized protein (DUF1499 family)
MTYQAIRVQSKLEYLTRLLKLRVKLMKFVSDVEVEMIDDTIRVRWLGRPVPKKISQFEEIEFPVSHLGRRIEHYKRKVRMEFSERHD